MTVARMFRALALMTLAVPVHAQQPTVEASAVAMRAQPLPVLDNNGDVISEDLIRANMRGKGRRALFNPVLGALIGAAAFALATDPGRDCTIYDPCTPKEEYYWQKGPVIGMLVGGLLGAAAPDGSVSRERSVFILREKRRVIRAGNTP